MDTLTPEERSERMGRVRHKDTKPEIIVRRLIHRMGYRYRLHRRDLPGTPDLTFGSRRKVIFVHGCFWHRHENCPLARMPKSRIDFWKTKLEANRIRDMQTLAALREDGWDALVIWECQLADLKKLEHTIHQYLEGESR